jgi:hypothetical protein
MVELLDGGLRGSIGVVGIVGVNDLAMTEGMILSVIGHCDVEASDARRTKGSKASVNLSDEHAPSKGDVGQQNIE